MFKKIAAALARLLAPNHPPMIQTAASRFMRVWDGEGRCWEGKERWNEAALQPEYVWERCKGLDMPWAPKG